MSRSIWLGLAWLALVVAPYLAGHGPGGAPASRRPGRSGAESAGAAEPASEPEPTSMPASPRTATPRRARRLERRERPRRAGLQLPRSRTTSRPARSSSAKGQPLAIEEAVALSIQNGLDVEVERYGPLIAEATANAAWGAYDPTLYGGCPSTTSPSRPTSTSPCNRESPQSRIGRIRRRRRRDAADPVHRRIPRRALRQHFDRNVAARFRCVRAAVRLELLPDRHACRCCATWSGTRTGRT